MRVADAGATRGFTLVELLVVVLLIGLGLGVSLTVDFADSPQQQKQQTVLLANALELAAQEAVLDAAVLGLDFYIGAGNALGYRWLQLRDDNWQPYALRTEAGTGVGFAGGNESVDPGGAALLPAPLRATLVVAGQQLVPEPRAELPATASFAPEILLLPTRELTPFTLSLAGTNGAASVLTADLLGRVRVDVDAPPPP